MICPDAPFSNSFFDLSRHPDRHQRPSFNQLVTELGAGDGDLLMNGPDVEPIRGSLGVDVDNTDLYEDLQNAYKGMAIVK